MFTYYDLIDQTFFFPTNEFKFQEGQLHFNNVPLLDLVEEHGTPLRITYLPKISTQIHKARSIFKNAFKKYNYNGDYTYCYCTKSSHFSFVLDEILSNGVQIETSSAFDISIMRKLYDKGKISKETLIICNGFKRPLYTQYISELVNDGFNCIPIIDNWNEIETYNELITSNCQMGIRVATDEEPNFSFYTSRLGVRYTDVVDLYKKKIQNNPKFSLKLLHFFINTGIKDSAYYWSELNRFLNKYCEVKKICPELDTIDIGGGLPIKTSLFFDYDFEEMINQIVETIQRVCIEHDVETPHIITEFGSFTVGESGAMIYSILDQKLQNDKELWYMIDGSFINNLPDTWALNQRFVLLALNHWDHEYRNVKLGGLTCDSMDYYNSEAHTAEIYLPVIKNPKRKLYLGFFHTGAYQEALGGYGGIQHCLIPNPKHVIVDKDDQGNFIYKVFSEEQTGEKMLDILGY